MVCSFGETRQTGRDPHMRDQPKKGRCGGGRPGSPAVRFNQWRTVGKPNLNASKPSGAQFHARRDWPPARRRTGAACRVGPAAMAPVFERGYG